MTTPQHREISVHCHGRLPNNVEDVVSLPSGVRVVMMNAGGTLCANAPNFDGLCIPPETFDPLFRAWMGSTVPDADTGLQNFAVLMTQLKANSIDRWCVLEPGTKVPNLKLVCNDRFEPFGTYTHPFAVDVEYTDIDGVLRVDSFGTPDAIIATRYSLNDDTHCDLLWKALGRLDTKLLEVFDYGRIHSIKLKTPTSFRPTAQTPNLTTLLADLGLGADLDPQHTVNIYLFVCAGLPASRTGGPASSDGAKPLAEWLQRESRAVRHRSITGKGLYHPYTHKKVRNPP